MVIVAFGGSCGKIGTIVDMNTKQQCKKVDLAGLKIFALGVGTSPVPQTCCITSLIWYSMIWCRSRGSRYGCIVSYCCATYVSWGHITIVSTLGLIDRGCKSWWAPKRWGSCSKCSKIWRWRYLSSICQICPLFISAKIVTNTFASLASCADVNVYHLCLQTLKECSLLFIQHVVKSKLCSKILKLVHLGTACHTGMVICLVVNSLIVCHVYLFTFDFVGLSTL